MNLLHVHVHAHCLCNMYFWCLNIQVKSYLHNKKVYKKSLVDKRMDIFHFVNSQKKCSF